MNSGAKRKRSRECSLESACRMRASSAGTSSICCVDGGSVDTSPFSPPLTFSLLLAAPVMAAFLFSLSSLSLSLRDSFSAVRCLPNFYRGREGQNISHILKSCQLIVLQGKIFVESSFEQELVTSSRPSSPAGTTPWWVERRWLQSFK